MVILAIFPIIIMANIARFRILAPPVKNVCFDEGDDDVDDDCCLKNSDNSDLDRLVHNCTIFLCSLDVGYK